MGARQGAAILRAASPYSRPFRTRHSRNFIMCPISDSSPASLCCECSGAAPQVELKPQTTRLSAHSGICILALKAYVIASALSPSNALRSNCAIARQLSLATLCCVALWNVWHARNCTGVGILTAFCRAAWRSCVYMPTPFVIGMPVSCHIACASLDCTTTLHHRLKLPGSAFCPCNLTLQLCMSGIEDS